MEMVIGLAVSMTVVVIGVASMRTVTSGVESTSAYLESTKLVQQLLTDIKFETRGAQEFDSFPPVPAAIPPAVDPYPTYPFTKFIVRLTATAESSYETKCRTRSNAWFKGRSEQVLSKLAARLKQNCGRFYPCANDELPWVEIRSARNTRIQYVPPIGAKPQESGIYGVALCVAWRPDGGDTYDVKAIAGYLANDGSSVGVATSSISFSNIMLTTPSLKVLPLP
jgi:hypothetical protein